MKKLLLSLAVLAGFTASAASYTVFDIANPGTWTGDKNGWTNTEDANGFKISYDKANSTTDLKSPSANTYAWRVYKSSSFTITSSKVDMKSIVITYDDYTNGSNTYYAELTLSEGWTGTLNTTVYTLNNESGSKTFTGTAAAQQVRIKKIVVSDETTTPTVPDTPVTPDDQPTTTIKAKLATTMADGDYVIVTPEGVAKNYTGDKTFGYLFIDKNAKAANNEVTASSDYVITFKQEAKGYTMKDIHGKFLGMDATHFGGFNYYEAADATDSNCYWTITIDADGNAKIENAGREGAFVSYKAYNSDFEIMTTDKAENPLVQLFKSEGAGVEAVEADANANAPVVYFNLQGQRVANPETGLYIRVQGNKATKVIL